VNRKLALKTVISVLRRVDEDSRRGSQIVFLTDSLSQKANKSPIDRTRKKSVSLCVLSIASSLFFFARLQITCPRLMVFRGNHILPHSQGTHLVHHANARIACYAVCNFCSLGQHSITWNGFEKVDERERERKSNAIDDPKSDWY